LDGGLTYVGLPGRSLPVLVLHASFVGAKLQFASLGGERLCHIEVKAAIHLADLRAQLMHEIGLLHPRVDVVFPGGELLSRMLSEDPSAVLEAPATATQSRFLKLMVQHAEKNHTMMRLRRRPDLKVAVVNAAGGLQPEVAAALVDRLDLDLLCAFEVQPPCGPVICRLHAAPGHDAAAVAGMYGASGANLRAACFEVPRLHQFKQLWAGDTELKIATRDGRYREAQAVEKRR